MSQSDLEAVYIAIRQRIADSDEPWADEAYPDLAPESVEFPYVIFTWLGGGENNAQIRRDSSLVIGIKGVAESLQEAMSMGARLAELFNDAERSGGLDGGDDWHIVNVTREQMIHLVETVDGGNIYHHGNRYRWNLEGKV